MITCRNGIVFCYHLNKEINIYGSLEDEFYLKEVKKTVIIKDFLPYINQYMTVHEPKYLRMKADILNDNVVLFRLYVFTYVRNYKHLLEDETNYVPFQISKENLNKLLHKIG